MNAGDIPIPIPGEREAEYYYRVLTPEESEALGKFVADYPRVLDVISIGAVMIYKRQTDGRRNNRPVQKAVQHKQTVSRSTG
jgi:hypothetical protein